MGFPLLSVEGLQVAFETAGELHTAVQDISFTLDRGEVIALVGESGSGKSVTAMSLLQLLPPATKYPSGAIWFSADGRQRTNLLTAGEDALRSLRGAAIAMVFQEPMSALNPVFTCGSQVAESLRQHRRISRREAKKTAISLFEKVQLPDPAAIYDRYPHELSGGQKQRVMIAMAISCKPALLVADEPTTALDVTVQQHILQLLAGLQQESQMGMLFITHDLALVRQIAQKVVVMYRGRVVEAGPVEAVFTAPRHPYTRALLACRPALHPRGVPLPVVSDFWDGQQEVSNPAPARPYEMPAQPLPASTQPPASHSVRSSQPPALLQVENLSVWYPTHRNWLGKPTSHFKAVQNISFNVLEGETLGIVGESGSGKTSLGRALLRLAPLREGKILYKNQDLALLSRKNMLPLRREMQLVFQDPYASLNPRMQVGRAIREPLNWHLHQAAPGAHHRKVQELLQAVNLPADAAQRYPHAFSGGQRQRIGIARALALGPGFIVFDESVSALDVSVQAQVLNLINRLKKEYGFTALFISHDLHVVRYISDRILVLEKGRIAEIGPAEKVFTRPEAAYTRKLLAAIPENSLPSRALNIKP